MSSSHLYEGDEGSAEEHPSPAPLRPAWTANAPSPSSTRTEAWSDDEVVMTPGRCGQSEDDDDYDLVSSRDLRSASASRALLVRPPSDLASAAAPPPPTPSDATEATTSASTTLVIPDAELVGPDAELVGLGEDCDLLRHHDRDHTDTESWRSSAASMSASASDSASESGRSQDHGGGGEGDDSSGGEGGDTSSGPMRLSFPDPIAASLIGQPEMVGASGASTAATVGISACEGSKVEGAEAGRVQHPSGLEAEYSMLLDVFEVAHCPEVEDAKLLREAGSVSSSLSSSSSSFPPSPSSVTSRQLSKMSISPDKCGDKCGDTCGGVTASHCSASLSSASPTHPAVATDRSTCSPPRQAASDPPGFGQHDHGLCRRASSPTPPPRGLVVAASRPVDLLSVAAATPAYAVHEPRQPYDHAHVHEWIRTAAVGAPTSSSSRGDGEDTSTATEPLDPVSCTEREAEAPPTEVEEGDQVGREVRHYQDSRLDPREGPETTPASSRSMASSAATVVPARGTHLLPGAERVSAPPDSLAGALRAGLAIDDDQAHNDAPDDGDEEKCVVGADPSMRAFAHAPGSARSRRAVTILSCIAAAVAIAAGSGWLDSNPGPSPLRVDGAAPAHAPSPTTISAATRSDGATATPAPEVMTFSETIKALIMETVVGPETRATLMTAMSVARAADSKAAASSGDAETGEPACAETPVRTLQDQAPGVPPLRLSMQRAHGVSAPRAQQSETEDLDAARARQILRRRGHRRRGTPCHHHHHHRHHRRRREVLSVTDRVAPPVQHGLIVLPVAPVSPQLPSEVNPKSTRPGAAPVESPDAHPSGPMPKHETSWLSSWLHPTTADLFARVSSEVLVPGLERGRHALVRANRGRRKVARHLGQEFAGWARGLQRRRERVHGFAALHRSTCERSPHLPECFFERLVRRGHRRRDADASAYAWWDSLRRQVTLRRAAPRSWRDVVGGMARREAHQPALDRACASLNPFVARQLATLRRGARRAQPLAYRGGTETVRHARKAVEALKGVPKGFDGWRGRREKPTPCRG